MHIGKTIDEETEDQVDSSIEVNRKLKEDLTEEQLGLVASMGKISTVAIYEEQEFYSSQYFE